MFLILLESFSVAISFAEERTNKQTRNDIFSIILILDETSNQNFGNEMIKFMVENIVFIDAACKNVVSGGKCIMICNHSNLMSNYIKYWIDFIRSD